MTKQRAMYGTWSSSVEPKLLAGALKLQDVMWASDGETLVWSETRTFAGGSQNVLVVQRPGDSPHDLTETQMSVRGRIGYGGGDFSVHGEHVYFAGNAGRLYRLALAGGRPTPITPAFGVAASPAVSPQGDWLVYVHHYEGVDGLALVDIDGSHFPRKFVYGSDFIMQPTWNADGTQLAFITWDFPNMPWDGTQLKLTRVQYDEHGVPYAEFPHVIAGDKDTSVSCPVFSPDGTKLAYISDQSGWSHIYLYDVNTSTHTPLTTGNVEYGSPIWRQGVRLYAWAGDSKAIYALRNNPGGMWALERITVIDGHIDPVEELSDYQYMTQIAVSGEHIALIAGSSTRTDRLITLREATPVGDATPPRLTDDGWTMGVITDVPRRAFIRRRATTEALDQAGLSAAQPMSWTSFDGETAHGVYFAPSSTHYEGIGAPPLIVLVHGGPTSQQRTNFQADVQFFTTRGFAVLTPNHRGSTGYGRAYMLKHRRMWGIYDVEDSATGATHLASLGLADPAKFVIMGGSAGGYTTLQSLVAKPGFYRAGVCAYGISNQFVLSLEPGDWKFESRYNDMLIGVLPDDADLFRERSPLFHADNIIDPVILFQGEDDEVVPKPQSDMIVAALRARGVTHEYHVYAGEGHGWRKAETIEHYFQTTLAFLRQHVVFG